MKCSIFDLLFRTQKKYFGVKYFFSTTDDNNSQKFCLFSLCKPTFYIIDARSTCKAGQEICVIFKSPKPSVKMIIAHDLEDLEIFIYAVSGRCFFKLCLIYLRSATFNEVAFSDLGFR